MTEVRWIKIVTDIFDDEKILLIESLPEADAIITIWFKLLCLAGKQNNCGVFLMGGKIPYTEEMFATIFRRPLNTVRLALKTFESFGMVEIVNGVLTLPNWDKHQSLDALERKREYDRLRMQEKRSQQKQIAGRTTVVEQTDDGRPLDKNREDKNRLDKSNNITRHKYGEYKNVLLTDDMLETLKSEFPKDWEQRIERLSSYKASTGKVYKNDLATIRNWARKDVTASGGNITVDTDELREMLGKV